MFAKQQLFLNLLTNTFFFKHITLTAIRTIDDKCNCRVTIAVHAVIAINNKWTVILFVVCTNTDNTHDMNT